MMQDFSKSFKSRLTEPADRPRVNAIPAAARANGERHSCLANGFNHKFNRGIYLIDKMARLPQDKVLNREKTISFPLRG